LALEGFDMISRIHIVINLDFVVHVDKSGTGRHWTPSFVSSDVLFVTSPVAVSDVGTQTVQDPKELDVGAALHRLKLTAACGSFDEATLEAGYAPWNWADSASVYHGLSAKGFGTGNAIPLGVRLL
jgi:hypothetical protein